MLPIRTVKASEDVEIPPQSEVVLEAICDDSTEENETVIVEPKSENLLHHKGILTGRTLTVRKNNQMFVRIMNLKDYPQQISKGEPIVHESTGKTPASVVFGAELRLPIDLISDRPKKEEGVNNYISHLQDRLKLTHAEVRQKMRIEIGEKVWLYNPKRTKGKSPKLQKSWEGPYTVVTRLNDVVYRIQKNPQAKMKIVHIDRLTLYQEPHSQ
ncbi:hypothetical protein NQ315_005938 [Exocentrus adspersus]|uniref:Integrase p58-like C-terminal domain-containing protein n=1 Tax=Exocentrus adspersus TaxID=1586481 RepID=A0AAV8VDX6_9CUCU|nr:hypothetical protein NQ315_005938 [Exocentrus adspersus]